MNAVVLIAHAPLADALRHAAVHVLPAVAADLIAIDVDAALTWEQNRTRARRALQTATHADGVLMLADVLGATPCNLATALARELANVRLLAGVNLSMLLRVLTYRDEPLPALVQRALAGGAAGILAVDVPPAGRHKPEQSHGA